MGFQWFSMVKLVKSGMNMGCQGWLKGLNHPWAGRQVGEAGLRQHQVVLVRRVDIFGPWKRKGGAEVLGQVRVVDLREWRRLGRPRSWLRAQIRPLMVLSIHTAFRLGLEVEAHGVVLAHLPSRQLLPTPHDARARPALAAGQDLLVLLPRVLQGPPPGRPAEPLVRRGPLARRVHVHGLRTRPKGPLRGP